MTNVSRIVVNISGVARKKVTSGEKYIGNIITYKHIVMFYQHVDIMMCACVEKLVLRIPFLLSYVATGLKLYSLFNHDQ